MNDMRVWCRAKEAHRSPLYTRWPRCGWGMVLFGLAFTLTGARAETAQPVIEFKVLLIIKRESDTYSPLFLPVRARMTDAEVARARQCFEVETPGMVSEITHGKVRFIPTVRVSEQPLRVFNPDRKDSAEFFAPELLSEVSSFAKPGAFDSAGYYFLHYDPASGYKIPRAGFGVGWYDKEHALGLFAVNCSPRLNPRDEIFLHEWMHGLDGFYGKKDGVALPKGWLHGVKDHDGYQEKPWRTADTFRGWMEWYRDYLNGDVREGDKRVGLGDSAWRLGPMRREAAAVASNYRKEALPVGAYPAWVFELMKGDLSHARLGPSLLEKPSGPGAITKTSEGWRLDSWSEQAGSKASVASEGTFVLESPSPNNAALCRTLALQPFKNYLFTAEVLAEDVSITEKGGTFGVHLYAGDSVSTKRLTGTTPWTSVALPFTTGAKAEACRLKMALGGFASVARGRASFRNVQVRQIGYPAEPATRQ